MKYLQRLLLATLFLFSLDLNGQSSRLDSLNLVISESSEDTSKVNTLIAFSRELRKSDSLEKAFERALEAKELSVNLSFNKGVALGHWVLGDLDQDRNDILSALDHYKESISIFESISLLGLSSKVRYSMGVLQLGVGSYKDCLRNFQLVADYQLSTGDTISTIVTYGRMANAYHFTGDFQLSIELSEIGLKLAELVDAPLKAAISMNNLGIAYRKMGETEKAINSYRQALTYARQGGNLFYQAAFYENIGIVHSNKGEYVKALTAYFEASRIYDELEDEWSKVLVGFNIGLVYKLNKEYSKALPYYKRTLAYDIDHLDTLGIITSQRNLGSAYLDMGQVEEAKKYLMASFNLINISEVQCLEGLGGLLTKLYLQIDQIDSAEYFINLELESFDDCDSYYNLSEVLYLQGRVKMSQNLFEEALTHYEDSYAHSLKSGYQEVVKKSSYALYEWYKVSGNSTEALNYHEVFQEVNDSLFNQENTRRMAWLEANSQMEKVSDSLSYLKEQDARAFNLKIEKQQQQLNLILLLGGVLLLILLLFYVFIRNRQLLRHQLQLGEEKQKGFKAVITAEEAERTRIAKDLHDGVVQQLGAIKLILAQAIPSLRGADVDSIVKAQEIAEQAVDETRNLSHQMMPKALIDAGLVPAMQDVIQNHLELHHILVDFQQFGLKDRYPNQVEVTVYRIFQELTNNIVKHAQAQQVDIQLMENGGKLILIVEDDGVGLGEKKGGGIGLNNISSRLLTVDGKVDYTSGERAGTVVTIVIPL